MSEREIDEAMADLADRVQRRLAARRADGEIPLELERELDRYVRAYGAEVARPPAQDRAREQIRAAIDRGAFAVAPAGGAPLRVARRAVTAATGTPAALDEVQRWRTSVEAAVVACIEAIDRFEADGLPAARDALAMVLDRLSALEAVEDAVADLETRLAAVEARLGDPR